MIEMDWRAQLAEANRKIDEFKNKSRQGDVEIIQVIKEKIVTVEKKVSGQQQTNTANAEKINKDCNLSKDAIDSYNKAVDIGNGKDATANSK